MPKQKIKLGDYVADKITGFDGVVVGITTWLNGCARIGIQDKEARNSETGLPVEIYWVDETTVKVKKVQSVKRTQTKKGGPNTSSARNKEPKY